MNNVEHNDFSSLQIKAEKIRKRVIEIIYHAKGGHTGGSLSIVDILTVLYFNILNIDPGNPDMPERDRFILSKGHSVESLYCVLAEAGFIKDAILQTYGQFNSLLTGHPTRKIPGIELNSGSLGHGLSVGVGMAIASRMDQKGFRVYVLMGDGEQGEGSVYEAAMAGSHFQLDNLVAIIDRNKLQISGKTERIMTLEPIKTRWESFGWEVLETDGHDMHDLTGTFKKIPVLKNKPHLIIANTVKGKGISFLEDKPEWHHGVPDRDQFHRAIDEIQDRINKMI